MKFNRHDRDGLVYLTIPSFDDTNLTKHCFTTRMGGFSDGEVRGLNLGFSRPDSRESVIKNFEKLCSVLAIQKESLVLSHQVHGKRIRSVTREDTGKGISRASDITNTDGLVTDERQVTLVTFYADCVPLYFLDPGKKAIGLAHAGWKGTALGIAAETTKEMQKNFGSKPEDILVGIGPSICRECYEVDTPVISRLKDSFRFWRDVTVPLGKGKYLLDLQQTNMAVLCEHGIRRGNITDSGYCTGCNGELFYSYRREGKKTGSLAALIQLV